MELIRKSDALHAVLHNQGDAAVAAVQEIKAVDAVVHGEWKFNGRFAELNHYACSNCNRTEFRMSDYCPNCGAKMKGDNDAID